MVLATTVLLLLSPVLLMAFQSMLGKPFFAGDFTLGLMTYREILSDPEFRTAFTNSLLLAGGMTMIALPVGALLAFLVVRTDLPCANVFETLSMAPMFISSIVLAFGFVVTLGPVGYVTLAYKDYFGVPPWYLYSMPMLAVLAGLSLVPTVFLYCGTALKGLNSQVEEAARTLGAGPWRIALTISLPLILPSILYSGVLSFLLAFEMFGFPLILGDPEGIVVLSTYLYKLSNAFGTPAYNHMAAVAIVMLMVTLPFVWLQRWILRDSTRYISISGKHGAQKRIGLGALRWPLAALTVLWLVVSVGLPVSGVILRSLVSAWGVGVNVLEHLTTQNFTKLFESSITRRAIVNSILVGVVGGAASLAIFAIISLAARKGRPIFVALLDYTVLLPRAMPGLVMGLAIFWIVLFIPLFQPWRSSVVAIWVAYTIVWISFGMRMVSAALLQVSPDLEEAGRVAGGSAARVVFDITLPIIRTGLIGAWVLLFVVYVREYSTGVYLLTPGNEVIGSLMVSLWGGGAIELVTTLATVNLVMTAVGLVMITRFGGFKFG